jgi:hypothetical protein
LGQNGNVKLALALSQMLQKWLLTKHLKEVYGLVVKKAKLGRPSTSKGGPQCQDHVKMKIGILGNVMAM